ncbi:MAG: hypothetical protein GY809_08185 [Planctomycetes bacterium]|nr:hypothetical protein [Planctomycetota bacterium]
MARLFWLVLSLGCIGWYLVVLVYVAIKGGADIKDMLKRLSTSTQVSGDDSGPTSSDG